VPWQQSAVFHGLVPKTKKAGAIPRRTSDRASDLGQAIVSLAIPDKALIHHHHPMAASFPIAHENGARFQIGSAPIKF
jgi:hypothetical protein